ncbi:dipeptide/oligopeptide/nickel ABC transporter permease/ATP-binding protein [Dactylosporangium sp. NPDC051484]|uniref:dipeptide/oligopeptide/nickel ABC transporter permease/ATP-binding protein n=1 Tax=Dactylosporangium sp. NPDC051484 TaxID=3154942 RepID=UPI0034504BD3
MNKRLASMRSKIAPAAGAAATTPSSPARKSVRKKFMRDRFAVVALIYLVLLVLVAVFARLLTQWQTEQLNAGGTGPFTGPSWDHLLGTDNLGRDNATRIFAGARFALRDAIQVSAMTLAMGIPVGLVAGYRGGWVDTIIMRLTDAIQSIPAIVLILAVAQVSNQSLQWVLLAIAFGFVPTIARLVRSSTLAVRQESFVEASLVAGTRERWIVLRRILPNVLSPIIVQATIIMGAAIFIEAALAIIGVGYPVGSAAWGAMLNDAFTTVSSSFWNMLVPGMAIAVTVLAFNLVGDGLRDALGVDRSSLYGRKTRMGLTQAKHLRKRGPRAASEHSSDNLLEVRGLSIEVQSGDDWIPALDNVSFSIKPGEAVGLVGESGAGKTLTSMAVMRLLPSPPYRIVGGEIALEGRDILRMSFDEVRGVRGREIGMIFQDPMLALNPAYTVGRQIAEAIRLHEDVSKHVAEKRAIDLLERVGIPDPARRAKAYPHEFSGGMRQRAMIAMALSCSPKLLIADEPTTAIDVTVQAQILDMLRDLRKEMGLSVLLVTHDLGVVAEFCDRAVVMYAGQIVEQADTRRIFADPVHPYTRGLLRSVPRMGAAKQDFDPITGQVPPLHAMPAGCRFHPRCDVAMAECANEPIQLQSRGDAAARCIRAWDNEREAVG